MIMMIPTQVTALGFLQLVGKMKLDDSFIPLIIPSIAAPVTFFYMKQYMESTLPLSLIEAARIDGGGGLANAAFLIGYCNNFTHCECVNDFTIAKLAISFWMAKQLFHKLS